MIIPWFNRAAGGESGPARQLTARLRSLEAECDRLAEVARREEAQFQRTLSRPPAHLRKYDVIRWREERRRERDGRLADVRDRQDQIRGEIRDLRRQLDAAHGGAAAD